MPDMRPSRPSLLARFADFHQEVANLRRAIAEGRLPAWLAGAGEAAPLQGQELALRVSSRLAGMLRAQAREAAAHGSNLEIKALTMAQYAMAALADEIFIFDAELEWPGREHWLDVLLEARLFGTHDAGRRFFAYADQIMRSHERTPLHAELAALFLLALQLGFKGRHRGPSGAAALRDYRRRLLRFSGMGAGSVPPHPAFAQAYAHLAQGARDVRHAPLSRWFALGRTALLAYLVLSTLLWLALMHPLQKLFGG